MLIIIAALADHNTIGYQGKLPWHIPEDLAWFKKQTWGHPVIMGHTTFLSLSEPLPGRTNIVLSHRIDFIEGITVCRTIQETLDMVKDKTAFVIGGAQIFTQFLPYTTHMYLTRIHADFKGDSFFPDYDQDSWLLFAAEDVISKSGLRLSFEKYRRYDKLELYRTPLR